MDRLFRKTRDTRLIWRLVLSMIQMLKIQNKIGEFNQLRSQLSVEMQKPDKDGEKMTALDTQIRELYDEIMAMPKMIAFNCK